MDGVKRCTAENAEFFEKSAFRVVILISADAEWRAVRELFPHVQPEASPYGEWFVQEIILEDQSVKGIFFQGGWGKISAAASTQYAINRWQPDLLINLGTCGGIAGRIQRGEILLAERTLVYDIHEQMGDQDAHIAHYSTNIDLSWLSTRLPQPVRRSLILSADRDLLPGDIPDLVERYGAAAVDWESAAIAWVAQRSHVRCLILRGVTDLVSPLGGEAYGDPGYFQLAARQVMRRLVDMLPRWIGLAFPN